MIAKVTSVAYFIGGLDSVSGIAMGAAIPLVVFGHPWISFSCVVLSLASYVWSWYLRKIISSPPKPNPNWCEDHHNLKSRCCK